jgi:hypothetical protein
MGYDYDFEWVDSRGNVFQFVSPYEIASFDEDDLAYRIPTGELESYDGEYQSDSYLEPRVLTLRGTLAVNDGSGPSTIQTWLDALSGAHAERGAGKLYRHSGRYLNCRVAGLTRPAESTENILSVDWVIKYRAADPLYYDAEYQAAVAVAMGTTNVTPGGSAITILPIFSLNVTTAGTISITETGNATTLTVAANLAGTWLIDCENEVITGPVGSTDGIAALSGQWIELVKYATEIQIATPDTAVLGAGCTVQYKRRWQTS